MSNLKSTEEIVIDVLRRNERARKDDFILYGSVLRQLGVDLSTSLYEFLSKAKTNKMPTFETVSRCRRHINELLPELADQKTVEKRIEKIADFKKYNLSGIGED